MASNGYVRRQCSNCLFYRTTHEHGYSSNDCILRNDDWYNCDGMRWVSATEYDRNPEVAAKHDEPCEHYTNIYEVRNQIRKKFGIKEIEINEYCM